MRINLTKKEIVILRDKNSRVGRNPKTKETKVISKRKVVLFKPSKELKIKINQTHETKT